MLIIATVAERKIPPNTLYSFRSQTSDKQKVTEQNREPFECYYCNDYDFFDNKEEYEKHVVLEHPNKLSYPSKLDLEKMNIPPKGKTWEN